jgi:tRNA-modifying protein YgfZ
MVEAGPHMPPVASKAAMQTSDTTTTAYAALTTGAALLDRSERGKLALLGPEAKAALNGLVTNEIEALTPGSGVYAAVLTPKGKMLGDLRVLDHGDELLLDIERVALQPVFDVIRHGLVGFDATLDKRTLQRGLLSLIGPESRAVCAAPDLPDAEHANADATLAGHEVVLVVTDRGVDVICQADATGEVRDALLAGGARVVDEDAAEVVRVESGRPRYGVDIDDSVIPQEAGLNARAVNFEKGCYVGQETVARLFYRGKPNRHLRGLLLTDPIRPGAVLRNGDRDVGTITSVVHSPRLGTIGLALVRREVEPGATVTAGDDGGAAQVVTLPFD